MTVEAGCSRGGTSPGYPGPGFRFLPRVALQGLGLGGAEVGKWGSPLQEAEGAAVVDLPVPSSTPPSPGCGGSGRRPPRHPRLARVLHGLGDGRGGRGGHHGEVGAQVAHGPRVVQVGVGEEEGLDLFPVQAPAGGPAPGPRGRGCPPPRPGRGGGRGEGGPGRGGPAGLR